LEGQFVSLWLLLRPVRLRRSYQENKVPASTARKVIGTSKPPTATRWRHQNIHGQNKNYNFYGKTVRYKIEIDGTILEKVKRFNYLGCELSLEGETGFYKKNRFQTIGGTI
jgi:hypothetical protein